MYLRVGFFKKVIATLMLIVVSSSFIAGDVCAMKQMPYTAKGIMEYVKSGGLVPQHTIGPYVSKIHYYEITASSHAFEKTLSWVDLGLTAASLGGASIAAKALSKLGIVASNALLDKIGPAIVAADLASLICSNDLKQRHGIKINVTWDETTGKNCFCKIGKDHGNGVDNKQYINVKVTVKVDDC